MTRPPLTLKANPGLYFYIPPTKRELAKELTNRWPADRKRWLKMPKNQLLAIFCRLRTEQLGELAK